MSLIKGMKRIRALEATQTLLQNVAPIVQRPRKPPTRYESCVFIETELSYLLKIERAHKNNH